jgi:hypothetical protein
VRKNLLIKKSIQLAKTFTACLAFLLQNAMAQETKLAANPPSSTLVEKNLPNQTQNNQAAPKTPEQKTPETPAENVEKKETQTTKDLLQKSTLVEKISSSVGEILLGNKVTSLMFDEEENSNINRAIDSLKNNQVYAPEGTQANDQKEEISPEDQVQENEKSYLYLASIIYFSPKDWAIWINDQKITPESNKKENELYVKFVERDSVKFLWKLSVTKWKILSGKVSEQLAPKVNQNNQVEVNFTLKQNQTFILSTNSVVEGKAVVALLKKREEDRKAAEAKKTNGETTQTQDNQAKPVVQSGAVGQ